MTRLLQKKCEKEMGKDRAACGMTMLPLCLTAFRLPFIEGAYLLIASSVRGRYRPLMI